MDCAAFTRCQLYEIVYESSAHSAYRVVSNPPERCREVTSNVRKINEDFSKIRLLTGLSGFKALAASCVLTALDPERHAVVNMRVWASLERTGHLERRKVSFDATDYVAMIEPTREIGAETGYAPVETCIPPVFSRSGSPAPR